MPNLPNLKCLDISGCTNLEAIEKFSIHLYSMNLLKEILLKGCNQNLINYFNEYILTNKWKHWPSKEKFVKKSYFMNLPAKVSLEPLEKALKPNMYEEVVGFYGSRPLVCREKLHSKIFSYLGSPMLKLLNKESSKNTYDLFDVIIDNQAKLEQLLKRDGKLNARSLQVNVALDNKNLSALFQKLGVESLEALRIESYQLTDVNLPFMPALSKLDLREYWRLSELTLPQEMNQLTKLSLSKFWRLSKLTLPKEMNQLTELGLSECNNLSTFCIERILKKLPQLTKLDLSNCSNLSELTLPKEMNQLTKA